MREIADNAHFADAPAAAPAAPTGPAHRSGRGDRAARSLVTVEEGRGHKVSEEELDITPANRPVKTLSDRVAYTIVHTARATFDWYTG